MLSGDICAVISKNKPLNNVEGITFRGKGKVIETRDRNQLKILMKCLFRTGKTSHFCIITEDIYSGKRTALVITSRGCPHHCTFCLLPQVFMGYRLRKRSAKMLLTRLNI